MTRFLLSLAVVFCSAATIHAQCDLEVNVNQLPVSCVDQELTFMGFTTGTCSFGGTYNYTWTAYDMDSNATMQEIEALTVTGSAFSGTTLDNFTIPAVGYNYGQVCLTVNFVDDAGMMLDEASYCLTEIALPQPLIVTAFLASNTCGQPSCLSQFTASGGTAPYTYVLSDGQVPVPGTVTCFESSGTYQLIATDPNGCMGSAVFTIAGAQTQNTSCATAVPLENGVILYDTLCTLVQETPSCGGGAMSYQSGWYSFNSENFSHANIAFHSGYNSSPSGSNGYFAPATYEIYRESPDGGCDGAELVFCYNAIGSSATGGISQGSPACFDLADSISIEPNTTYYIKYYSYWTSWVPVQGLVMLSNEPITPICGCTDNTSCNYDPDALIPDGTCGWSGCMDQGACNYQQWVTCDNGSCIYGSNINGLIFHDLNGDGIRQEWQPEEPILSNIGVITIEELGVLIYPDANGQFVLPDIPQATYTISFDDPNGYWLLNAEASLQITLPTCNGLEIPLLPASEALAQVSGISTWENSTIHCAGGFSPGIYLYNNGNMPLSGTFTMTFDPMLTYSDELWVGAGVGAEIPTQTAPGTLTWTIDNQPAGSVFYYQVHINGPGAATTGQSFPFTFSLTLNDAGGGVFYANEWNISPIVTCSYDPNDKQATPVGWTDQHFITAGQEIEYRIRFQNTGNAPAFDVRIDDQLDVEHLDLSSFTPIAASHSYSTIVNPDGFVQFVFDNIMLPDSVHDEPNSHGWVVYRIRSFEDLQPLDEIQNSAAIFFDDNEPIITNTYTHTIFSCDLIPDPNGVDGTCQNQPALLNIFSELDYTETYHWSIDGDQVGNEVMYNFPANESGLFDIILNRTNPYCNVYDTLNVEVWPAPESVLVNNGGILVAPAGTSWQWYLNGEPMDWIFSEMVPMVTGVYSVSTTNEFGCSSISNEVEYVVQNVEGVEVNHVQVYPNPAGSIVSMVLPQGYTGVRVLNATGQVVWSDSNATLVQQLDVSPWAAGVYRIETPGLKGVTLLLK